MEALKLATAASSPQATVLPGTQGTADTTGETILGLGSLGLGAAALFSDARLKTDVERIGTLDSGPGVYSFRFKGDTSPQIGVVAQEVEKLIPEAVSEVGGLKVVFPGKL